MNAKQVSVSSYSDISNLGSKVEIVHLRKFVSRRLLREILKKCPNIKLITLPEKLYSKSSWIKEYGVEVAISKKGLGRQSMIEKMFLRASFSMKFKSVGLKNNEAFL